MLGNRFTPSDRCYDFKNISPKIRQKIWRFLLKNKAKLCKNVIITFVIEKNAKFFADNSRK
jgi:hypothetical protein